ncbi:hypothetical protein SpCBS45565_g05043 [Spizellomyces sp. 'palustris']|nr:hypothetical protein SpCBS45565_g05043 [Spizellomyces sp. 'palustris']
MKTSLIFAQIATLVTAVSAHSKLTAPLGLNVDPAVDLGSQADVALGVSANNPCGRVLGKGGPKLQDAIAQPRATFAPGSEVDLGYFIVNQDGAGPVSVSFSADAGQTWTQAQVLQNAPGRGGVNLANLRGGSDAQVKIQVPNMECPAGSCVMMVRNPITFGSCAPVEIKQGAANNMIMTFENQGGKPVGQGLRGAAAGGIGAFVDKPAGGKKAAKGAGGAAGALGGILDGAKAGKGAGGLGDILGGLGGAGGGKAGGLGDILGGVLGGAGGAKAGGLGDILGGLGGGAARKAKATSQDAATAATAIPGVSTEDLKLLHTS